MRDHKPTFTVSRQRRPLVQRITPLGWALVGACALATFLLLASLGAVLPACSGPDDGLWLSTETAEPTRTPRPTDGPTPTATLETFPAWWEDQMTEDEDGHQRLPAEVEDRVWEAFIGGLGCANIADLEEMPEAWLTRPATETLRSLILDAAQYLEEDDPDVWRTACNGAESLEQKLEIVTSLRLVAFGPRGPVLCDELPTHCLAGVKVNSRGIAIFEEKTCLALISTAAPCFVRGDMFHDQVPHQFYAGFVDYDERSGTWRIASLDVTDLPD